MPVPGKRSDFGPARDSLRGRAVISTYTRSMSARKRGSCAWRGCGKSTGISLTTRPGLVEKISMRSHIWTASSMLCVTSSTDLIGSCPSPHRLRKSPRALAHLGPRPPQRLEPDLHVLEHREPREEREALEHHGDAGRGTCDRVTEVAHHPARGLVETGDHAQQRRLARA